MYLLRLMTTVVMSGCVQLEQYKIFSMRMGRANNLVFKGSSVPVLDIVLAAIGVPTRVEEVVHIHQHTLPQHPMTVIDFYGATATGLEALLKSGNHIGTFAWMDTSPDALVVVTHRITQLQQQYLNHLPTTALHEWGTLLPTNTNLITPEGILTSFSDGIGIIIANLPDLPKAKATHPILHHHEKTSIT
jgi:hypothetical protein